jgi:hypothetical protein
MDRVRLIVVFWVVCVWGAAAPVVAATVGDWVSQVESAATAAGLLAPGTEVQKAFAEAKQTLTEANVLDEQIGAFVWRYASPDVLALARRRQANFLVDVTPAVTTVKRVFSLLPDSAKTTDPLRSTVGELQTSETTTSMRWDLEVLRRLERKYGPGSAKLNGLEVLIAYSLQRTPGFGIDRATGYPGPLETVLAYSATYLTHSDGEMRLVSVAEFGLRRYIFARGWGGSGLTSWLRPAYFSGGFAMSGESDDPLTSPFQGQSRYGAFFGWGELKVAFLGGDNKRLLVTQQVQVIPWVF